MKFEIAYASEIGKVRARNEDCIAFNEDSDIILICDGMGGHSQGELASRIAANFVLSFFEVLDASHVKKLTRDVLHEIPEKVRKLIASIRLTNWALFEIAREKAPLAGMGTTLAGLVADEKYYAIVNVGDSRVYRYLDQQLEQLTVDHTFASELLADGEITAGEVEKIQGGNSLTRAVGADNTVKIDLRLEPWQGKELFLLCTDGLTKSLSDEEILKIIKFNQSNLHHLVAHLIDDALLQDGKDNISIIAARNNFSPKKWDVSGRSITIPAEAAQVSRAKEKIWRQLRNTLDIKKVLSSIS